MAHGGDLLRGHATLCKEIAGLIDDPELAREFRDIALESEYWAVEIDTPPSADTLNCRRD